MVIFVIRNLIATILALFTVNWQVASGITDVGTLLSALMARLEADVHQTFGEMVGIQVFFLLMAIPLFYYGKSIRAWTSHFGPMKHLVHDH